MSVSVPQREDCVTGPGGLSQKDVDTRVSQGLVNHSVRRTGRRTVDIIRSNVFTRINAMLGVLLIIVLSTGSWINAAFGLLIVVNSSIGIIQELRAKRTLDRLTIVGESKPTVVREGEHISVLRDELVLDDLIDLGSGDQLVVDGVVRSADGLMVDESLLTGESDPVLKKPGDAVFSGSFVSSGKGTYQATAIGDDAYAARLIAEAGRFQLTDSRLQAGINSILQLITYLLVPTGILTIWTQLSRTGAPLRDALLSMVAALVPMVPEGLVLMTSIAFAVGVVRLGRRNALINELPAIEGLARVNVVCTDKTGTLTENRMELEHIQLLGDTSLDTVHRVLQGFVAADNRPNDTLHAIAEGVGDEDFGDEVLDCVAFDSARKWSGVSLVELGDWVLGAPDVLLPAGSETLEQAQPLEERGLRVLLLAAGDGASTIEPVALVVLGQKLRPDAADTLDYFEQENVEVKVVSGDHATSVGAVAHQLGIVDPPIDARTLPSDPLAFREAVVNGRVFGRVTPEQKRDIVHALQQTGSTVAMTGDGVNDVLALKDANIGVSMGAGSPATRSVAQLVLLDNGFSALPHVVGEGRRVIGNIERVANLFLTKTVYSALMALIVAIWGVSFPFQPIHVTMVGWFTIGIPAFILSLAPNHERARPGFVGRVLRLALPSGAIIGGLTVLFWIWVNPGVGAAIEVRQQASTATLAVLLIMALWVLCIVARPYQWWKIVLLAVAIGFYVVLFSVPALGSLLLLDNSNHGLMLEAIGVGVGGAALIEACWQIFGRWKGRLLRRIMRNGD
ncbi:HAD-IC family P-type ATPase [Corynebacterium durum]|uniref:HAD-IC family P-type ATPase n=1 Tax=Corynebacterium durum TaxID=61592 RepID=UPI0040420775